MSIDPDATSGLSSLNQYRLPGEASGLAALLIAHLCAISSLFAPCDLSAALRIRYCFDEDRPLEMVEVLRLHAGAPPRKDNWLGLGAANARDDATALPAR
jgi:hypothetical protein